MVGLADSRADTFKMACDRWPDSKGIIKTSVRFARATRAVSKTYSEFLGLSCNSIWVHHRNKYRNISKRAAHSSSNADSQWISRPLSWKREYFGQCDIFNWLGFIGTIFYSLIWSSRYEGEKWSSRKLHCFIWHRSLVWFRKLNIYLGSKRNQNMVKWKSCCRMAEEQVTWRSERAQFLESERPVFKARNPHIQMLGPGTSPCLSMNL